MGSLIIDVVSCLLVVLLIEWAFLEKISLVYLGLTNILDQLVFLVFFPLVVFVEFEVAFL